MMKAGRLVMRALAVYVPIRASTIWPALILAASRKERVIGRTVTLIVSMMTRKGLSQSGAPPGRSLATHLLVS